MKKYSGVALNVIVFVFLFIFLRIFSEYHFYCVEQNQLFQLTPIFIIDKLMQPGGLAMVLSGCLVQFFILPNVGAMITAALLTSLGALFWAILKRIDPRSHGILWAWLLCAGDKVQLVGFGGFETKAREARMGRNPKTKEPIEIPATTVPVFKPGKALKDQISK